MNVVLELVRGVDLEVSSSKHGVTATPLSEWHEACVVAGEVGLRLREEDLVDEQSRPINTSLKNSETRYNGNVRCVFIRVGTP